jgi:hypothetical protein
MSATANHDNHAPSEKKVTLNGLIIIGFFGLIIAGMLLAVYASRYVPDTLARLSAAVYLTSDPAKNTGKATTTPTTTKPQTPSVTPSVPKTPTVSATSTTGTPQLPNETGYTPRTYTPTYTQPRVIQTGPRLYGLADLALTDVEAGYIKSGRYIEDDTIPANRDMYVRFTVRNEGTNVASNWKVRVRVEHEDDAVAYGGILYPNGTQTFTLRVENPQDGNNLTTRIDVDFQNALLESDERNNDESIDVDVDN